MEAIEALLHRRSCRSFIPKQLCADDLKTILDCGLNAPSGSNKQDTKIIVVQDTQKIEKLSKISAAFLGIKSDPFYGAPTICMVLAPKDSGYKEKAFALNPIKNASLVIGAMQTAAFAIGVGSCWINCCSGILESQEGKEILQQLNLNDYTGVGCCILGYPAKKPIDKKIKEGRILYY